MTDTTTPSGTTGENHLEPIAAPGDSPVGNANGNVAVAPKVTPAFIPILKRGQRYVSPAGRHSQQTHQRAQDRAALQGHATVKEQHAHDKTVVTAKLDQITERKRQQEENNKKK